MIQMSLENFRYFLKKENKDERTINDYVSRVEIFLEHINNKKNSIEMVRKQDLIDFIEELKTTESTPVINRFLFAFSNYFKYIENQEMYNTTNELSGQLSIEQYKIRDFLGINKEDANKLAKLGIRTAQQMIENGKTVKLRKQLSEESGIPEVTILEIVKLSNLARIGGLKQKRARLYYESGFDTIEKIANSTPQEIVEIQKQYVKEHDFDGTASLLSEAEFSVELAKYLSRIIEYE